MTFQEWFDAAVLESFITKKPISQQDIWDAAKQDTCRERKECDHVIGFILSQDDCDIVRLGNLRWIDDIDYRCEFCPNCGAKLDVNTDYAAERAAQKAKRMQQRVVLQDSENNQPLTPIQQVTKEAMGLLMRQSFVLQPWAKMGF